MKNSKRIATAVAGACAMGALLVIDPAHAGAAEYPQGPDLSVLKAVAAAPSPDSNDYYISPGGSDSNPGTKHAPFKTLMKAQSAASAGDLVYIRGGIYNQFDIPDTDNPFEDVNHYVNDINKSGITYAAYQGMTVRSSISAMFRPINAWPASTSKRQ